MSLAHHAYKAEPIARAALHHYVFAFDARVDSLPRRIDPALVERFLREELKKRRPDPGEAERMVALALRHETQGIVPDLLALLDCGERSVQAYVVSLRLTAAVGLLGTSEQRAAGLPYYRYLLSLPFAAYRMDAVLACYQAYGPEEPLAPLRRRALSLAAELSSSRPALGSEAHIKSLELAGLETDLQRVEKALALEAEIDAIPATEPRLARLVAIYLELDAAYHEVLGPWAVRRLRAEARHGRSADLQAAFRRALPRLAGREAAEVWRARALHAVAYFGGSLSGQEVRDAASVSGDRGDEFFEDDAPQHAAPGSG